MVQFWKAISDISNWEKPINFRLLALGDVRVPDLGQNQADDDDDGISGGADKPDGFVDGVL